MKRRAPLVALLVILAALLPGPAAFGAGAVGADSPAHCTDAATGADTHTTCAPPSGTPPGAAISCHDYTVGSDAHVECAPVPAPRQIPPRGNQTTQLPPVQPLRCYTYRIGASAYTECR